MGLFSFGKKKQKKQASVDKYKRAAPHPRGEGQYVVKGEDTRPFEPHESLVHKQHDCIKVLGTIYFQPELKRLEGETVPIRFRKAMKDEMDYEYLATLPDETVVGGTSGEYLRKGGLTTQGTYQAEIARPIYYMTNLIELYVPKQST